MFRTLFICGLVFLGTCSAVFALDDPREADEYKSASVSRQRLMLLGLDRTPNNEKELSRAFRKVSMKYHGDKQKDDESKELAHSIMQDIVAARDRIKADLESGETFSDDSYREHPEMDFMEYYLQKYHQTLTRDMKEILSQALSQNKPSMDVGELEKIVDSHSSWITSIIGYPRFRRIYMWLTSIGLPPHIFAEGLSLLSWGSEKSSTVSAGALSSLGARLGQVAFDGSVITHLIDPVFIDSEIKTLIAKNDPRILDASLSNYIGQRFAESVVGNFSNVVSTLSNIHQLRNTSSVAKFNEYLQKLTSGEIEPKTAYQRDLKRYSGSYLWWRNTYAIMLFVELILGVWKHYEFRQEIYRRLSTNMLATDSETNSDLDGLVRTAKTTGKINNIAVAEVLLGVIRRWMMNSSANQHIENAEKYRKKRERADKITARKKEHK